MKLHSFPCGQITAPASRRDFLRTAALGFGSLAFSSLAHAANPLAVKQPHFPARARRVILLFMEGAPSQMDTIDYKPELVRRHDEPLPPSALPEVMRAGKGEKLSEFGTLYRPVAEFKPRGQSGLWISDALPHLARHADDLCLLNGMVADSTEHGTATQQFHCGLPVLPRPSMGAWLMYGLGTENQNLPGFVVVSPPAGTAVNCGTDFLPGVYQSTILRDADKAGSEMIRYLNDKRLPRTVRRSQLEFLQDMNRARAAAMGNDSVLESLIESNELAFRMQAEAPEVLNLDAESQATKQSYGIGEPVTDGFGRQCLVARRLAEAGVRFIQLTSKGWDHHGQIAKNLPESCRKVDKPIAGLLADLKARGLLDDTLVLWSGEFGRTPQWQSFGKNKKEGKPPGRGHNPFGFSLWMAGGGVKRGFKYGATDDFGYSAVEGRVHVHDLHATILHLLGLDHEKLTYTFAGRPYRLTDVYGSVVKEIIA
jgi:hypothetical protein